MATEWGNPIESFSSGNWNRWIDADPLVDAEGGVDFHLTVSSENPPVVSDYASASLNSNDRENP